jgi:transcriptional regulator with XRE-family HTH domain
MLDFKQSFGANLKLLRKSKNLTQEKLSEMIDVHPRQMSKIEAGEHFPSCRTLERLCIVLGVLPSKLFNFEIHEEMAMAGTENKPVFRAIQNGSIIRLIDTAKDNYIEEISTVVAEDKMFKMSKNINKAVKLEYLENNKITKFVIFYPDGTKKEINNSSDNQYEEDINYMLDSFKKVIKSEQSVKFLKLALNALNDDKALEQLEFMIAGIKLACK